MKNKRICRCAAVVLVALIVAASGVVAYAEEPPIAPLGGVVAQDITTAQVSVAQTLYYTGKELKPEVTVSLAGRTLVQKTDYTVSYLNNKLPGTALVIINGTGNYAGGCAAEFTISLKAPASASIALSKDKHQVTVTWKKTEAGTGYTVMTADDEAFTRNVKKKHFNTLKTLSYSFENPSWKQTTYVMVRTYLTVGQKTYYSTYTAPKSIVTTNGKWIEIDLTKQELTTHMGKKTLKTYLISSGKKSTPTATGTFYIYLRLQNQTMRPLEPDGSRGYTPNVRWVQYFHKDLAIHGCYWHNNFGHPMSHGCINMRNKDAKEVFDWSPMGTKVVVHK